MELAMMAVTFIDDVRVITRVVRDGEQCRMLLSRALQTPASDTKVLRSWWRGAYPSEAVRIDICGVMLDHIKGKLEGS